MSFCLYEVLKRQKYHKQAGRHYCVGAALDLICW